MQNYSLAQEVHQLRNPPQEPDTDGGWRGMMVYVGMPRGMETSGWDEHVWLG